MGNYQRWKMRISDKIKQEREKKTVTKDYKAEKTVWFELCTYSMVIWVVESQRKE